MQNSNMDSNRAFNPLEAWTAVGLAMTEASMHLATSTARATMACLSVPVDAPSSDPDPVLPLAPARSQSPPSRSAKSRSWYRAPYRSPFDPLFWLTPGHPVDHPGDWLALGLCAFAPGMMPNASLQSALQGPFGQFFQPARSVLSAMPTLPSPSSLSATANVIDFSAAYAAYRTAGGHASAQIIMPLMGQAPSATSQMQALAEAWSWMLPFAPISNRSRN